MTFLDNCLKNLCSSQGCAKLERFLLGDQTDENEKSSVQGFWPVRNRPGTFLAARCLDTALGSDGLGTLEDVLQRCFDQAKTEYPRYFAIRNESDVLTQAKHILESTHYGTSPFWSKLYLEEHEDVIARLLLGLVAGHPEPIRDSVVDLSRGLERRVLSLVRWLEKHRNPQAKDWLRLSIQAEALSSDWTINDVATVGDRLWKVISSSNRVDAEKFFFHILETNTRQEMQLACFPSTRIAAAFTLKFYEHILKEHQTTRVTFVPRSVRVGNYASYQDVLWLKEGFPGLRSGSFVLHDRGPKLRAIDPRRLHREITDVIEGSLLLDIRGSHAYRSLQGIGKPCFFGFMAISKLERTLVGSNESTQQTVFIHQNPFDHSFEIRDHPLTRQATGPSSHTQSLRSAIKMERRRYFQSVFLD